jgi:hypothetical protein
MTTFYCLRFETPPTLRAMSPYLYPPGTGWPGYTPRHWVPFSSPHATCRATVEVFEPSSTPLILAAWESCYIASRRPPTENTASSIIVCWFTAAGMCLPHSCVSTSRRGSTENAACNSSSIVAWRHSVCDAFLCYVCTGHHLATAVYLPPQFMLSANTPQFISDYWVLEYDAALLNSYRFGRIRCLHLQGSNAIRPLLPNPFQFFSHPTIRHYTV